MKRIALALAVIASLFIIPVASVAATGGDVHKAFVCKYVGKPGVDERLQTGNNPIDVDFSAIDESPVVVGSFFKDAQGRSFVLALDIGQDEPDVSNCPSPETPPPPTPTPTPTLPPPPPPPPTPTPTPYVTPTPSVTPTPTGTSEPTPTPTPTPTPSQETGQPPTPTPSVSIDQFAAEPGVCRLDDPQSRIHIRRLAGLIALTNLDFFVDGDLITAADIEFDNATNEAFIPVAPGVHTLAITDGEATLFTATVDCPTCFRNVTPTPNDVTSPPKKTLPPTDTADVVGDNASTNGILPLLLVLLAISGGSLILTRKRR